MRHDSTLENDSGLSRSQDGLAGMREFKTMKAHSSTDVEIESRSAPALEDWNLLRSFIAIYETGTLTEAATRLKTTQPSMGRHLRELETSLKEPLFVRLPGRLKSTARADVLFEALLGMRHAVREAESVLASSGASVSGVVRLAVSEAYGYHVIPAILVPLLEKNLDLEIELSVSNQTDNLLRRDADIAVRFFRPQQDSLIAVKVGETELGLYARDDYLARHGVPSDVELEASGVLAGNDREPLQLSGVVQGPAPKSPVKFRFRTDFVLAREAAALSGSAIAMMFTDIAKERPELKRVLAKRISLKQEVWLCAHEELRRSARMRYVWEHLEAALRQRFT
jgi:DNA-binding transcriptional LysR family regulator